MTGSRTVVSLVAIAAVWLAFGIATPAQEQQQPPQEQQQQSSSMEGELVRVDTEAMTLSVRAAGDSVEEFRYNETTEVAGAQDSIAGLADAGAPRVTIHFSEEGGTKTATRIEVQAAQP